MRLNIKNVTYKKNLNVELMVCKLMKIVILEDCIISWDEIECVTAGDGFETGRNCVLKINRVVNDNLLLTHAVQKRFWASW